MAKKSKTASVIADAIQKADKSYFFEDYNKQARAVLKALEKAGFEIIPRELPNDLAKEVANTMKTGRVKPEQHVKNVMDAAFAALKKSG